VDAGIPRPPGVNIITGKWLFKNKLNPDGSLERRKVRWVVRGFTQRAGVDFHQTFSPVIKPASIRTVLHLAASRQWPVHQMSRMHFCMASWLNVSTVISRPDSLMRSTRITSAF
jgi:hypothetical protein